jgi:hypothetical protein
MATPTPTTLKSTVGSNAFAYTREIADRIYFSNGTVTGKFTKGGTAAEEWGTPVPTNPTVTATTTGGMFAGDYRVTITWIADEESGAPASTKVTVAEGGGITLSAFPTAPAYVTHFAVYVSSVNGEDLYLYNEYVVATTSVSIIKHIGTVPLQTQFYFPPAPPAGSVIADHYGRIYYSDGAILYYTEPQQYGLQCIGSFMPFDSAIQTVVSTPNALYVGTLTTQYKIVNIDGEGIPEAQPLQACGSVKGSVCYHENGITAYFMSNRGFIEASPEGLKEISFDNVAIPYYASGMSTILYENGMEYLVFIGTNGAVNPLASDDYTQTAGENAAWAVNLSAYASTRNGSVQTYPVAKWTGMDFNSISGSVGANSTGIFSLIGDTDNGTAINGYIETGKQDLGTNYLKRVTDAYLRVNGGKLKLSVTADNTSAVAYSIAKTTKMDTVKANLARGAKGDLWKFKIENSAGSKAVLQDMQLEVAPLSRRR